jgi:lysophospholipase L1-like esterase
MAKNQLTQSLWLLLLIIGCLLLGSLLPPLSVGSLSIRRINLLADIQSEPETNPTTASATDTLQQESTADSTIAVTKIAEKVIKQPYPCPPGITCLEDFSPNKTATRNFFQALRKVKKEPVRIAFYGDSFIEGDVLCGSFRDTLQGIYGGRGVGFVPLASDVTQYRVSIQHSYSNWKTYSLVGKYNEEVPTLGISGYAFVPLEENEVIYKPGRKQPVKRFDDIRIFYQSTGLSSMNYVINDTSAFSLPLTVSDTLQVITLAEQAPKALKLQFTNPDSVVLYGVSFEASEGLYVDNFAMRGNSGMSLQALSQNFLKQFNDYQDYSLILLQYGLNLVTEKDSMEYNAYKSKMVIVINRLKEIFPKSSIVLIGISDRAGNIDGKIQTIPAILRMRNTQREIAKKSQIAFWDLYTAMGGENTMIKYVAAQPPLASKDYTHLNFRGGQKLAKKLADALLYEQNRYEN